MRGFISTSFLIFLKIIIFLFSFFNWISHFLFDLLFQSSQQQASKPWMITFVTLYSNSSSPTLNNTLSPRYGFFCFPFSFQFFIYWFLDHKSCDSEAISHFLFKSMSCNLYSLYLSLSLSLFQILNRGLWASIHLHICLICFSSFSCLI